MACDDDEFFHDDALGMAEHYTPDGCAACGRPAFGGLLCDDCNRAADRVRA